MYPITAELAELFENQRQVVRITFDSVADSIVLTEADIKSGGLVIDRTCVSGDTIELGSVIASELGVQLNNTSGQFNDVTLEGAECFVEVGTKDWSDEQTQVQYIPMGYFTVDGSPRKLDTISFKALDRMVKFDKAVDYTQLSFPMTVSALLSSICTICGVTLNTEYQSTWVNKTRNIPVAPEGDNLTYRQLLSWICEIMGVCAYMSPAGTLNLHWYGQAQSSTPSITAAVRYNSDVQENAITLTGVRIVTDANVYLAGTNTYVLTIEGNPLIQSGYQTVANNIYNARGGMSYTPFTATVKSMPHLYPLDIVNFIKGESTIPSIITKANYALNNSTVLEGTGQTQIENDYAELNPMTTQQTVVLNRLHSKTVQEFKVADGEVLSTIANSQDKYDESTSPGTITLRGYSTPADAGYAAAEHSGEYYLNETNGYVYLSNGTSWSKVAELTLKTTELDTKIDQTATKISSEANARLEATVGYSSKNWLDLSKYTYSSGISNVVIDAATGSLSFTGTGTNRAVNFMATDLGVEMYGKTYTVSCVNNLASTTSGRLAVRKRTTNAIFKSISLSTTGEKSITFTPDVETFPDGWFISVMATGSTSETGSVDISQLMLRDGSIDDDTFEPYKSTVETQISEANSKIVQTAHGITQTVAAANAVEYIIPPGVIVNYHGYGFAVVDGQIDYTTTDTGISATGNTGKFFLDQSTGMLYVSDGTTWNNSSKQQLPEKFSEYKTASETSTEINQTANEITLSVMNKNGDYVVEPIFEPKLVTQTKSGVTLTKQDDDSYIISGTTGSNPETFIISTESGNNPVDLTETAISENGSYLIRGTGDMRIGMWITYGESYSRTAAGIHDASFTLTNADTVPNTILVGLTANTQFDNVKFYPRIYNSSDITKLGVADGALCSKISLSDEQIVLGTGRLIINAGNFQLDQNGTVSMTGGKIKTNNYSPASGSTKTVGGKLNLSAIGNNLLLDTANFKIEGDGDVSATNTTLTGGVIKTSNYAAASGNTKTVGGQINLNATGSTPMIDTANFKVSGGGAVSAEDATFTNCTIEGGSFEVDSTEQSGQVTSRIHFSNSYLGDGESIEISSEKIKMSRTNTGGSRDILLDYDNNTGSELKLETQSGSTWDKALYSASKIRFNTRTSPAASITYVDANNNERNALVFGGSPSTVTLGDKDTITKIFGMQTHISFIDSNNVEHSVFGYVGGAVGIGDRNIPLALAGSSINANGKKLISDVKTNPATTLPVTLINAYSGNVVDWVIYGNSDVGKNLIDIDQYDTTKYDVRAFAQDGYLVLDGTFSSSQARTPFRFFTELEAGNYVLSGSPDFVMTSVGLQIGTCTDSQGTDYSQLGIDTGEGCSFTLSQKSWISVRVYLGASLYQTAVSQKLPIMIRPADTSPDFEPYQIGVGQRTKNLLEITATSTTTRGVTFTVNKTEGTITANGKASSSAYLNLLINAPSGNYYYSGCALGGSESTYDLFAWDNTISGQPKKWDGETNVDSDYGGTSQEIKVDSEHSMQLSIRIRSGYTCNSLVFKPMLRAADTDAEFIPYGYCVPLTISQTDQTDKNYDIFIGQTPLTEGQCVSSMSAGQDIGLFEGENTITTTLTNKPKMTIKYFTT